MIEFPTITCGNTHFSTHFCYSQNCVNHPVICNIEECQSNIRHLNCTQKILINELANNLVKKNQLYLSQLQNVVEWYNKAEKIIFVEKEELLKKIQIFSDFGLSEKQVDLKNILKNHLNLKQLTSAKVLQVIQSLRNAKQQIKRFSDQTKIQLKSANQSLFASLQQVKLISISNQQRNVEQQNVREEIKNCGILEIQLNGYYYRLVPERFKLSSITGLSLNQLTISLINKLKSYCPFLKQLIIGDLNKSNVDDECAFSIANNLQNLKRLEIWNSPLSEKGAIYLSMKLKKLDYFFLGPNKKITQQAKIIITNNLQNCKKIKFSI